MIMARQRELNEPDLDRYKSTTLEILTLNHSSRFLIRISNKFQYLFMVLIFGVLSFQLVVSSSLMSFHGQQLAKAVSYKVDNNNDEQKKNSQTVVLF